MEGGLDGGQSYGGGLPPVRRRRDRQGEEGRGRGKCEEAAVPSTPGPEEASPSCSPLWLEPPTIPDLASQCLPHSSPAPYV